MPSSTSPKNRSRQGSTWSFADCVSPEERSQRLTVTITNILVWLVLAILAVSSFGVVLVLAVLGWLVNALLSEYNVRKLQAVGATVSAAQLPMVAEAVETVCQQFNIPNTYRVIVIPSGEANAFALKLARKRVVVILSELLAGIIDKPEQLRALIAHEICHCALDHGWRGVFERYKPAKYKAGRELTCDNAGLVAADSVQATKLLIRKLCVGRHLYKLLSEEALILESRTIYSGISGWLIKRHLTHPPAGARLENIDRFAAVAQLQSPAAVPAAV